MRHKTLSHYVILFGKGFCMGIADVIPGVSGGTIAFMVGIYEELINGIHAFNITFLKTILRGDICGAFGLIPWRFLFAVFGGILTAIFSLSHLMKWLLQNHPVPVNAFFFGLVAATVVIIARSIRRPDFAQLAVGIIAAWIMYMIVGLLPIETPTNLAFLFFCGIIAICAMILPGISGAFILLILGKYDYIITAVADRNFIILFVVAAGCAVGLLSFIRALKWLFLRYHDLTLAVLSGLVLGSLRRIWPWKAALRSELPIGDMVSVEQINILPQALDTEVTTALGLIVLGIIVSMVLSKLDQS